jgi:hypothetical protein
MKTEDRHPRASWKIISSRETERGIYIDFEGFEEQAPTMIGVWCDGIFNQIVFDGGLELAAKHSNLTLTPALEYLEGLVSQAKNEHRRIIAFSSHELTVFRDFFHLDISDVYADARLIAKPLRKTLEPKTPVPKSLKDYLAVIGYERPISLGERKTTSRIRAVKEMLTRKSSFDELTPVVKAKWTKLLQHNMHDVLGMKRLVEFSSTQR